MLIYITIIILYIIIHIFLPFPSSQYSIFYSNPPLIHSILVGTYIRLFIFPIRPRTFYRSGWLRCDVFMFRGWGGVCVIILYIIIHILLLYYYTYTIIYYIILLYINYYYISSSHLFYSSSLPIYLLFLLPSSSPNLSSVLLPSSSNLPNIHSILVGTYIYLFIFFPIYLLFFPNLSLILISSIYLLLSFILYLSVLTYTYLYSFHFNTLIQQFLPRTFYRSGWLRCVGFMSVRCQVVFYVLKVVDGYCV
jgi:hypothetical protein